MFYRDGFVFGGEPLTSIRIENIKPLRDKMMLVTFNNGETRLFDANCLKGEVFEPLSDETVLRACTLDHGVPTWLNGEIDCAPEFIYENSCEHDTAYEPAPEETLMVGENSSK